MPCQNGGTCVRGRIDEVGYKCLCSADYKGKNCDELKVKTCNIAPCMNGGTCSNKTVAEDGLMYRCNCTEGYVGTNCHIRKDFCTFNSVVCQHGGTCNSNFDLLNYECHCSPGYVGQHCETETDECASNPCKNNGKCIDLINKFECICDGTGYQGPTCQEDVDECENGPLLRPCLNNSTCTNTNGDYQCNCPANFCGKNCQKRNEEVFDEKLCGLSVVALVMNLLLIVGNISSINDGTVHDFRGFLAKIFSLLAAVDIVKIISTISSTFYGDAEYQQVYRKVDVFHTMGVAGLLIFLGCAFFLDCQEKKVLPICQTNFRQSDFLSLKWLIPLFVVAAIAPFLLTDNRKEIATLLPRPCCNSFRVLDEFKDEKSVSESLYHIIISIVGFLPLVSGFTAIGVAMKRSSCQDKLFAIMPVLKCDEFNVNSWVPCHTGLQFSFKCPSYVHGDEDSQEGKSEEAVLHLEDAKKEILEGTATMCIPEDEVLQDIMDKDANSAVPQDQDESKDIKLIDYSEDNYNRELGIDLMLIFVLLFYLGSAVEIMMMPEISILWKLINAFLKPLIYFIYFMCTGNHGS